MKKLKLPKIKKSPPPAKSLSMDEYYKFVHLHFKCSPNNKENIKQKKIPGVKVPFVLK